MSDQNSAHSAPAPIWVRFLLAFACLVLAFASALFSTVAREQGHFWATLVLASLALILATLVGVTTVPVLARRVMGKRVRDAFQFEVTRVGILYVASIVLIGIAALNTGNNLLYIIVAVMLGAILVSGLASATTLRNVQLEVWLPERTFAGQPVKAVLRLKNFSKRVSSFSITVKPIQTVPAPAGWQWVHSTFTLPPGRASEKVWLRLPDRQLKKLPNPATAPAIECPEVYFPFLKAGGEGSAQVEAIFPRRGCYQSGVFGIRTRFPFAFLAKTRHVRLRQSTVVYPHVQLSALEAPRINGALETFLRGQGSELYGLREYQARDPVRSVDWKATAKSGSLMVCEFTREDEERMRIVFDNPRRGLLSEADYEQGVSLAASLAWHLFSERKHLTFVAPGFGVQGTVDDFLSYLAVVQPEAAETVLTQIPQDEMFNVVFTARSAEFFSERSSDRCFVIPFGNGNLTEDGA